MNNNFNEQDSLRLINEMISQAKNNFQKGMGDHIIFWGYAIAALSLSDFCLLKLKVFDNTANAHWVWALTIPLIFISIFIFRKKDKNALVKTHIDTIISNTWFAFFWAQAIFILCVFIASSGLKSYLPQIFITPVILIMSGLCLYITSVVSKYKPFLYASLLFWSGAVLCIFIFVYGFDGSFQFIILAVCMICGFCIPGHILNKKAE